MAEDLLSAPAETEVPPPVAAPERPSHRRLSWPDRARLTAAAPYLTTAAILLPVYLLTMLPSAGNSLDTAKFNYLGRILGTAHAPGYPLYTMLNAVIVRVVPFGDTAWRTNLLSALFGVAACLLLVRAFRELGLTPLLAAVGAVSVGLTKEFWIESVVAEVYTLNALFIIGVLTCLLVYERTRTERWLVVGLGLYAFSFAHHTSGVLLLPGLVVYLVVRRTTFLFRPRVLAVLTLCGLAALSTYGYLFWRTADPSTRYLEAAVTDWSSLYDTLTGKQFESRMFGIWGDRLFTERLPEAWGLLTQQVGLLLPLTVLGVVTLVRRRPLIASVTALWAVLEFTFAVTYQVSDWYTFFLPVWLVLGLWTALGLGRAVELLRRRSPPQIALVAVVVPLALLGWNYGVVDRSADHSQDGVRAAVAAAPDQSVIFALNRRTWHQFNYDLFLGEEMDRRQVYSTRGGTQAEYREAPVLRIRQFCTGRAVPAWTLGDNRVVPPWVSGQLRPHVYGDDYAAMVKERGYPVSRVAGQLYRLSCERSLPSL